MRQNVVVFLAEKRPNFAKNRTNPEQRTKKGQKCRFFVSLFVHTAIGVGVLRPIKSDHTVFSIL